MPKRSRKAFGLEPQTSGPWKWINYPDGRKLLAGRERAVIHCPDGPMSVNDADMALIASAPDILRENSALRAECARLRKKLDLAERKRR